MPRENADGSKTYTSDELAAMPVAEAHALLRKATKIEGTAVVRDANGNIKYDDPSKAGSYGEDAL